MDTRTTIERIADCAAHQKEAPTPPPVGWSARPVPLPDDPDEGHGVVVACVSAAVLGLVVGLWTLAMLLWGW